jgi:hypothetical protein
MIDACNDREEAILIGFLHLAYHIKHTDARSCMICRKLPRAERANAA